MVFFIIFRQLLVFYFLLIGVCKQEFVFCCFWWSFVCLFCLFVLFVWKILKKQLLLWMNRLELFLLMFCRQNLIEFCTSTIKKNNHVCMMNGVESKMHWIKLVKSDFDIENAEWYHLCWLVLVMFGAVIIILFCFWCIKATFYIICVVCKYYYLVGCYHCSRIFCASNEFFVWNVK